ncbi:Clp protease N-terminal domain-containing protein [Rudaeicoccus suwonensis]|uniref:ClpA/ClpB-like protein n=1 Tax=Rudaeicoccus suwonensis TaxID=657409 RepID=A0A561E732_9MICO|nr:Clp protease N-terminal domain-containing protein [Rudaeicoccus suwonensis]TWE11426.1 ClpA/ClpB-like protein [Rudaeicoccus suwonensis]
MFNRSDTEIKIAFMQAMTERSELGHEQLGPDHILLGLLTNVRGSAFKVLSRHGITYDDARVIVADRHQDDEGATETPTDTSSNLDEDREALRAIGIDLDKVRAAVRETFGHDLADGWGERRGPSGRGRTRGRDRDRGERGAGERERGERGGRRRGPRDEGDDRRHRGPHHEHCRHDHGDEHRHDEDASGGHPRDDRGHDGPWRGGPHRRGAAEDRESFGPGAEFGPFGEFFGGPRGRGSRGPQSRRFRGFGNLTPSLRQLQRELFGGLRAQAIAAREEGRRPTGLTAGHLLAAIIDVEDPVVEAVLATADDPQAMRRDIAELAGQQPTT